MDAITTPEPPPAPDAPDAPAPRDQARRLWQAPVFTLGVAAVVAVWFLRPYLGCHADTDGQRELNHAREALDKDPEHAAQCAQRLLDRGALAADREGEAEFLRGSALSRVAERSPGAPARE